jgi:transcriptional regulator with XRE-family HTH domain
MQQGGAPTHRVPGRTAMERGERFKNAIYERAAPHGWTTDVAIAAAAGVSTNTLGNWWKGKAPELGSLVGLADALDESLWGMLNLWQGREPEGHGRSIAQAVSDLLVALDADRVERSALTRAIAALARSLAKRPGDEESRVLRAPRETAG